MISVLLRIMRVHDGKANNVSVFETRAGRLLWVKGLSAPYHQAMKDFFEVFPAISGQWPSGLHSLGHRPRFVILHVFQRPKGPAVYRQIKRSALQAFAGTMLTLPGPLAQARQSNGPLARNRHIPFNQKASPCCPCQENQP
jgi:hypothetical protein